MKIVILLLICLSVALARNNCDDEIKACVKRCNEDSKCISTCYKKYSPSTCGTRFGEKDALLSHFSKCHHFSTKKQGDLMSLSGNIYDIGNFESFVKFVGGSDVSYIQPPVPNIFNSLCAVTEAGKKTFIVCRGAAGTNISTLAASINSVSVNANGIGPGTVAFGFYSAYKSVESQIDNVLGNIKPGSKIYCTGHSFGGVLATFICDRAKLLYQSKVCGVYTFGSPKFGTQSFKDGYFLPTHRFEISSDPVPQLPTSYPNVFVPPPPLPPVIQNDTYVEIGDADGSSSTCQLVKSNPQPNYNAIFAALFLPPGLSECSIADHFHEKYCSVF